MVHNTRFHKKIIPPFYGLFAMDQNPLKEDVENMGEYRRMLIKEEMKVKHNIPL